MSADLILLEKFIISMVLGGLIGLEREKKIVSRKKGKSIRQKGFGGIRTFILISLLGSFSTYAGQTISGVFHIVGFIIFGVLLAESYFYYSFKLGKGGMTSEIGAIIAYLIGVTCLTADIKLPIAIGIITTMILSLKKRLHRFAYELKESELRATLKFAIIAFIILPFLPQTGVGPLSFLNLYKVWLFVVIISGITFLGYILNKSIGPKKGFILTGLIGGLISSTSVISSIAKRFKTEARNLEHSVSACVLSYLASVLKISFEIIIINWQLFIRLAVPFLCMMIVGIPMVYFITKKSPAKFVQDEKIRFKNPFTLKFGLTFGLMISAIFILSELALNTFGDKGVLLTALLAGFAKIDAIAVSMAEFGGQEITYFYASLAVMIGLFVSAFSKVIYSLIFGGKTFTFKLAPYLLIIAFSGLAASFLQIF